MPKTHQTQKPLLVQGLLSLQFGGLNIVNQPKTISIASLDTPAEEKIKDDFFYWLK